MTKPTGSRGRRAPSPLSPWLRVPQPTAPSSRHAGPREIGRSLAKNPVPDHVLLLDITNDVSLGVDDHGQLHDRIDGGVHLGQVATLDDGNHRRSSEEGIRANDAWDFPNRPTGSPRTGILGCDEDISLDAQGSRPLGARIVLVLNA